jgi:Fe-S-cluster containining protein
MNYCNYCPGYCCYRLKGSVLLINSDDINRLARHYSISDGEARKRFMENRSTLKVKDDGSCIFQAHKRFMENRSTLKVKDDGSCIFQAQDKMIKRCTVHHARPQQCRLFPYNEPCPYLVRDDLLAKIQPRLEESLKQSWQKDESSSK